MHDRAISSIMTRKVLTAKANASLKNILSKMRLKKVSCVIIVNNKIPLGIVTERDIVRLFAEKHTDDILKIEASSIMSTPPITVLDSMSISSALNISRAKRIRHLIVINKTKELSGLVTQSDLSKEYLSALNSQWELIEHSMKKKIFVQTLIR